ncbi:MAG TPA: type II toxin-antitoxin system VapC family toxin [Acidimicrobiia bacterium]
MVDLLLDTLPADRRARFDTELAAPDLLFVEVASGLARGVRRGLIGADRARVLFHELLVVPIEVVPVESVVTAAFDLRDSFSLYDACYVALAQQLDCGLLTSDHRLARVIDSCGIDVPVVLT